MRMPCMFVAALSVVAESSEAHKGSLPRRVELYKMIFYQAELAGAGLAIQAQSSLELVNEYNV